MSVEDSRYKLHGTITSADGRGLGNAEVIVSWQRIRTRFIIANAFTSEDGRYLIEYDLPKDSPDTMLLVVEVRSTLLEGRLESSLLRIQRDLQVDLAEQPRDPSEYSTLLHTIEPFLDSLPLINVEESDRQKDISFLTQETTLTSEQIMRLVVSAHLQATFSVTAQAWYAFLRLGIPTSLQNSLSQVGKNFTLIGSLVQNIGSSIASLTPDEQTKALQTAVQEQYIGDNITAQVPAIVQQLQAINNANVLNTAYLSENTSLGQLLNLSALPKIQQSAFAQALIDNTQPMEQFWQTLATGQSGFTPAQVASVQQVFEVGGFVGNQVALLQTLLADLQRVPNSDITDLAKYSKADWLTIIVRSGANAIPPSVAPTETETAEQVFAGEIYDRVTRAYPTVALASRIPNAAYVPQEQRAPLTTFFTNNSQIDLVNMNLGVYLNQKGAQALAGVTKDQQPAVLASLKSFQRVLRLTPQIDTAETLLKLGINSAAKITVLGKAQFTTMATAAGLTLGDARQIHCIAEQRYASVLALYTQFNTGLIGIWPGALGSLNDRNGALQEASAVSPSLTTLFGSQDFCAVDQCTSVLGAAAYLTDLLLWLGNRQPASAYKTLLERRPDIGNLLLDCPNTNTELPYIDLVNELLEDAVSPPAAPVSKQTPASATTAQLQAAPMYVNADAYVKLAAASYPQILPYNTSLDELRTYLQQSSVALWQLRLALQPLRTAVPLAQAASTAAERFQIDSWNLQLITTPNEGFLSTTWNTANPVTDLAKVATFLKSAGITYEQLNELLGVTWVFSGGTPSTIGGVNDSCDTTEQTIAPLDLGRLDAMHRFLRLWRSTGWQMWELDLLLSAPTVGAGSLDEQALVNLFTFRQLLDSTHLSVDQLLAFFQNLDVASHRATDGTHTTPLYAQIFLTPAVPPDQDLTSLGTVPPPALVNPNLTDHIDSIRAALQISAADVTTLFALTNGELTLNNLSLLYRLVTLANTLNLSITDLISLVALNNMTVVQLFAAPAATLGFIQTASAIQKAGFTVAMLTYILSLAPTSYGLTDTQIVANLTLVQTAIQKIQNDVFGSANPPATVLQTELAQLPVFSNATLLANTIAMVNGSFTGTATDSAAVITAVTTFMAPTAANAALYLPLTSNPADPQARQAEINTRASAILAPLAVYLTQTQVTATVASSMQMAANVAALLMQTLVVPGTPLSLLTTLTDPVLITPGAPPYTNAISSTTFSKQYLSIQLLSKVSAVVNTLHLVNSDLSWLLSNASVYGGLDLTQLPVAATQPSLPVNAFLQTVLVVQLGRAFTNVANSTATPPPAVQNLYQLISAIQSSTLTTEADIQSALAQITGWIQTDIAALAAAIGVSLGPPNDYLNPATYKALRALIAMVKATSGTGAQLVSWSVPAPDESAAQTAQQALKSRYTSDAWLQAAPAMMNPIRENRRTALIAWLLGQSGSTGSSISAATDDDLFNHFLIDVQMSSCMLTSRIVQAYLAVQLFVQRCLMNLESGITINLDADDGWNQWTWMQRFQLWVANREVFLYPENWMIETERPNGTELFQQLAQQVHQQENTAANFENIILDYIDALDGIAHLVVTGTCYDSDSSTLWVVARTVADPPTYYLRSFVSGAWTGWQQIQLTIQAHQVVPAVYRRNLYLFWPQVKVSNEPQQQVPPAQATVSSSPAPPASKYVAISLGFSAMRNGSWGPAQSAKGQLYDVPLLDPSVASNSYAMEALYTLKTQTSGSYLWLDIFRLGATQSAILRAFTEIEALAVMAIAQDKISDKGNSTARKNDDAAAYQAAGAAIDALSATANYPSATHLGRATFDGKFEDLELRDLPVLVNGAAEFLLTHAQQAYGTDAQVLLPLTAPETNLATEPFLVPQCGALVTSPRGSSDMANLPLLFNAVPFQQGGSLLLWTAPVPFRVVGPNEDLNFDPTTYFFYGDTRRSYFVESERYYQSGRTRGTTKPGRARILPFEMVYSFHRFYHPYTTLFWHELSANGLAGFYNRDVQVSPDTVDSSGADVFSFTSTYTPVPGRVDWGENNEIVDFSTSAAYGAYNWELFFHIPLYLGQLLSQNQQFEDAMTWYNYIFNPTNPGPDPVPQRYWIPKPLFDLTSAQIQAQNINNLLQLVNERNADAVAQVALWRANPYDPFLIADQRPVAYMKNVVMCYLDNLIAWADNLFSTESREALNQATLLYVLASEILGPQPQPVTPPTPIDQSFLQLKPNLDAFANALTEIENVVPPTYHVTCIGHPPRLPSPETFYFKIPPNDKLLGYWSTLADRLFKLRHCQNLQGGALDLPLFDAPIDPGLLIAAEAAGVDLNSVLSDVSSPLPNYRFTVLYAQAMDFCNAVRAYGAQLLTALEKSDADSLALLLATTQQQLLEDQNQSFQWKIDQAQSQIDNLTEGLNLANAKYTFNNTQPYMNDAEGVAALLNIESAIYQAITAAGKTTAAVISAIPSVIFGGAGFGGSPVGLGMETFTETPAKTADAAKAFQSIVDSLAKLAMTKATYDHRADTWAEQANEAQIQVAQANAQIKGANLALKVAQLDQANHQTTIANLQKQIDFLQSRFSNQALYDWMVSQLSATYFQSYQLAYAMAKRAERCYQYELGLLDSSFINFGYWDSLKRGLLAGEALNHDLRRMQASYLDLNVRRFEISRFISLSAINPHALFTLLQTGQCDFDLAENLFDGDYPGHYQRRIQRVSVTVVYPNPGVHDNVKCTLTLVKNSVRLTTDLSQGYAQLPSPQTDPRFTTQFGAIHSIVTGNAQDDPGLFITAIASNIADQRYLPFEGAGCISSWHLELPPENNDIDLTTVGDVLIHLHYTALDGGAQFKQAAQAAWVAPTSGTKLFSALNDFGAPPPSTFAPAAAQQAPASLWQTFLTPTTPPTDQELVFKLSPSKFPNWTRGKTITITNLTVYVISWIGGTWVLEPQSPPFTVTDITLLPMAAAPIIASGTVTVPPGTGLGTWTFKLRSSSAADFQSLKSTQIGDVVLMVDFTAN